MSVAKKIGRGAVVVTLALLAASCGGEDTVQPVATDVASLENKVADDAVLLMDRASFADTYKKLGAHQFAHANDLSRWAAIAATENDQCDRVAMINVSDAATREKIVWFADCANRKRVIIDQEQAEDAQRRFGSTADAPTEERAR